MPETAKKKKCPDCDYCQMCSESRCRLCRSGNACCARSELGSSFTYGQYLEWQNKRSMKKIPVIDISKCSECESCLAICPEVFKRNMETGLIEVADLDEYPEEPVDEAINICPEDCISWEEI